jgi:signal transduction histidine kinase
MASRRTPVKAVDQLAERYAEARATIARAARAMHDEVSPLLTGAGMQLSLIPADFNATPTAEALSALNDAMERVRALSELLNPSPAERLGLREAFAQLAEQDPRIELRYDSKARPAREVAAGLYEITVEAIHAAFAANARRVRLNVTGETDLRIRVLDDGTKTNKRMVFLRIAEALGNNSGIIVQIIQKKSTIVSIKYADRRAPGRRP